MWSKICEKWPNLVNFVPKMNQNSQNEPKWLLDMALRCTYNFKTFTLIYNHPFRMFLNSYDKYNLICFIKILYYPFSGKFHNYARSLTGAKRQLFIQLSPVPSNWCYIFLFFHYTLLTKPFERLAKSLERLTKPFKRLTKTFKKWLKVLFLIF